MSLLCSNVVANVPKTTNCRFSNLIKKISIIYSNTRTSNDSKSVFGKNAVLSRINFFSAQKIASLKTFGRYGIFYQSSAQFKIVDVIYYLRYVKYNFCLVNIKKTINSETRTVDEQSWAKITKCLYNNNINIYVIIFIYNNINMNVHYNNNNDKW